MDAVEDNCPLSANTDQVNDDGDIWGDACDPDKEESMMALWIDAAPRIAASPLTTQFTQQYVGSLDNLLWNFWDGTRMEWLDPQHTYVEAGDYVVTATATFQQQQKIVAKLPIEVLPNADEQVACAGSVSDYIVAPGESIDLSHIYAGPLQKVAWIVDSETIAVDPGQVAQVSFQQAGRQRIEMQCYNNEGERVGLGSLPLRLLIQKMGMELL